MSRMIVNQIKDKENVILAGDTNVLPNTETINNLEKYLKNVFKDELTTTFNMKIKTPFVKEAHYFSEEHLKGFAKAVVDMIFVSPNLKVVEHYQPKVDVSDHYPLAIVLEV
ncbi:hypothetical protein A2767_06185 [Candidatus Roizmanbacteria bacterium RIFCSPHIGHO2_01_FULL_35_10]|nr:MAG: hypothetical protein A2767_06185 [Candidatus Roizmanbacteria bacterium RIFCSPHIGHO2_01_FULL_35_10]